MGEDERSFKPIHAKALVLAFGTLVFTIDMAVPADLNVAIFYSFVIILCAWTRSTTFLWSAAAIFAALVFPGLLFSRPPVTGPVSWVDETNRVFSMGALFLVAAIHDQVLAHLGLIISEGLRLLEQTVHQRRLAMVNMRDNRDITYLGGVLDTLHK